MVFSRTDIEEATHNFFEDAVVGKGGFGKGDRGTLCPLMLLLKRS